ncbi:hypothetical protein DAY19_11325 [Halobacteriovorax vibrionivorans]|uniref:Lipoprotein n=1 Tax=Halobacteriovorax vibrionivorans TaxID=2152716 RepID=A0ABY0IDF5_9BACT|nr:MULTISPECIES: hypothetical protein [Halobacteriovorax]RZF20569.1 hypothetical protein DAY19_11325 [Halobacteriovorax vibrionivorans]TGD47482.1 hypothetical protein EP118_07855 [Halobacteriovorax sp. Y22]
MSFNLLKYCLVILGLFSLAGCEDYGKEGESDRGIIRAGQALEIVNTELGDNSLNRMTRICEALEEHHDNILRNVFSEDFIFSRRQKVYGDPNTRDITNLGVYIEAPNDYDSTPVFKGTRGTAKNFITDIPTENNLYLAKICDYTLNNVGTKPKVQEKVGGNYHVFNVFSDDGVAVGIYTKNSNGNYYLYRSYEYRFDINKNSRYYGMAIEQSEIFIRDYRGSDYSVLYQKFERAD